MLFPQCFHQGYQKSSLCDRRVKKVCDWELFSVFQADFSLEYQPLRVGDTVARLEFSNSDLGLYLYDLNLKATAAGPERALYFRTCLGQNQVQVAKFLNFAKQKTDYTCKVWYYVFRFLLWHFWRKLQLTFIAPLAPLTMLSKILNILCYLSHY